MLQHIVLFKFPQPLNTEEQTEMRNLVQSWPTEMDFLRRIRFGPSIYTQYVDGYQYLLLLELEDLDGLDHYMQHPAHLKFGAWTTERGGTFLVFNYMLDENTVIVP